MHTIELVNSEKVVLVDEALYWFLSGRSWKLSTRGYVYRSGVVGIVLMHREIMADELGRPGKWVVDHWNGDKLDNRKANLRVVKQGKNILNNFRPRKDNRSGIVGVYWDEAVMRWKATCGRSYLGSFNTMEEAEVVRKREVEARGGRHSKRVSNHPADDGSKPGVEVEGF